jgi:hypothetical protein
MPPPPQEQQQSLHQTAHQQRQEPILIHQVPNNTGNSGSSLTRLREIQLLTSIIILNLSIANQAAAAEHHIDHQQEDNKVVTTNKKKLLETALRLAQMSWSIVSQLLSVTTHAQALEKPTLLILAQTTLRQLIAIQEQQQQQAATTRVSLLSSNAATMKYYHLLHDVIHTLSMIQATRALFNSAHAGAA